MALKKSDAVFSGKVVTIKDPRARREGNRVEFIGEFIEVTFRVVRSWKFVDSSEITILTPLSSCGYRFKVGEQYLVWADLNEDAPAKLVTHLCTRTDTLAYAGRDLKYLGKGKKPTVKERVANHNQPSSQRRDSAFRVV